MNRTQEQLRVMGERLREARETLGIELAQVYEASNGLFDGGEVALIETAQISDPPEAALIRLCDFLQVDHEQVLGHARPAMAADFGEPELDF